MSAAGNISSLDKSRGLVALDAILRAGFPDPRIALQVSYAESSWDPKQTNHNKNGSVDYGLFQINTIHNPPEAVKFDPIQNARFARELYDGKHNASKGWTSWVAYTTGRYNRGEPVSVTRALLATDEAQAAMRNPPKPSDPAPVSENGTTPQADEYAKQGLSLADKLNPLRVVQAAIQSGLDAIKRMFATFIMVLIGIILIVLGFYLANHEKINELAGKLAGGAVNLIGGSKIKAAGKIAKAVSK